MLAPDMNNHWAEQLPMETRAGELYYIFNTISHITMGDVTPEIVNSPW